MRKSIAVLNMPSKVLKLILFCQVIISKMTNNPNFSNAAALLAQFADDLAALAKAQEVAASKAKGSAAARNNALGIVMKRANQVKGVVQTAADADPDHADDVITSAGFSVKHIVVRQPQQLEARQGEHSGEVALIAPVVKRTFSYQWQWSTDQKNWSNLPLAMVSTTTATGLTPGMTYYFRYQFLIKSGWSDWSQVITLIVK